MTMVAAAKAETQPAVRNRAAKPKKNKKMTKTGKRKTRVSRVSR